MSRPKLEFSPAPRWDPNRPSRAKEHTPTIDEGRPTCPGYLDKESRQIFRKLCKQLEQRRALTRGDGELLTLYATTWRRWRKAMADVAQRGEVVISISRGKNGEVIEREKKNPWLLIAQESERAMVAILDRLGLTPLNKEKVKKAKADKEKEPYPVGSLGWQFQQALQQEEENAVAGKRSVDGGNAGDSFVA